MTLDAPHHDGSERHVSTLEPSLGDTVTVWLRVPHADVAERVWVRTTPDAEPHYGEAVVDRTTPHETWWRADIELHNPVVNYRFLLDGGSGYRFVNGTGVHHRQVGDAADFRISTFAPPPSWLADTTFYQVFPDRFANSGAAREWPSWAQVAEWDDPVSTEGAVAVRQVYGGDLPGIEAHLDHLDELGVGALYLTPIFPARSSHRYDADTFAMVDPLLGGDEALVRLAEACHRRGIRIMTDLTINHTGGEHEWFIAAQKDATSPEAAFYFFRHHPDDYVAWYDVPSLPKLDLRDDELRRRLVRGPDSVLGRWMLQPFALDGWRIDVANMAGRLGDIDVNHDVAVEMRATMAAINPDAYLVGEHFYDASRELDGDGWHGVMNYMAFTRPAWCWLRGDAEMRFIGDPTPIPRLGGASVAQSITEMFAVAPWRSTVAGFNLLGSHDIARFRSVCGSAERQLAGAGLLLTMPGVPMIFAGDEVGVTGETSDTARQPMQWDTSRWDSRVFDGYRSLTALRASSPALRHGGLRWVHASDDVLMYLRESLDQRVLVRVACASHGPVVIPRAALDGDLGDQLHGDGDATVGPDSVTLGGDGPTVDVWELT